jgi:hypothetical protein
MASYLRRQSRLDDQGRLVVLLRDGHDGSWFISRLGDPKLDPAPLGAFASPEAARRWADAQFHGGSWHPDRGPRVHV